MRTRYWPLRACLIKTKIVIPMKKNTLLFFFLLLALPAFAGHFETSPKVKEAYEKVLSLRFVEAQNLLEQIKTEEPGNLLVYHVENYIDFFKIYINEDEDEFDRLKSNKAARLDKIKSGDPNSPYYLFLQADIRLQWALARLKFEEYFTSFTEVNKAYKLLKKNQEKFPDFMPNLKDLGILHAMVGTIPDNYQWGVKLLSGLDGTIEQGRAELETVLEYSKANDFLFTTETTVLYAFFLLHLDNEGDAAWEMVSTGLLKPGINPLHCFIMANIAMRTGRNDEAIKLLSKRPEGKDFYPFPYLKYMLGTAKLRRLDKDADQAFQQFLKSYKGRNFIKETYQKLAWHELVNYRPKTYHQYMNYCLTQGAAVTGGDKNALEEAELGQLPDVSLLKARLLFDGGYYSKAYKLLDTFRASNFATKQHQLEYNYRMGRICHGKNDMEMALKYYRITIEQGGTEKWFYACNAALQSGLIYEAQGNDIQAKSYFQTCLSLKPSEYRSGLHQKAKAGLSRLKKDFE